MKPDDFLQAARVPLRLKPQAFGMWYIRRIYVEKLNIITSMLSSTKIHWPCYTLLLRDSWRTIHLDQPECVMEDSRDELRKHLPIWLKAKGRVLVTGLGLGCVVRGLLANRDIDHVHVIEIDRQILRVIGHEFVGNHRVTLQLGDALTTKVQGKFDYAWHDIWTDGPENLQVLHARLLRKYHHVAGQQGAWAFPRCFRRAYSSALRKPLL